MRSILSAMVVAAGLAGLGGAAQAMPVPTSDAAGRSASPIQSVQLTPMERRHIRHRRMERKVMRHEMRKRMIRRQIRRDMHRM